MQTVVQGGEQSSDIACPVRSIGGCLWRGVPPPPVSPMDPSGSRSGPQACRPRPSSVVLDHVPALPVHRRNQRHGHARWNLHERRLRIGLLQPGPQRVLQPHHHRAVDRHLLIGTIEVLAVRINTACCWPGGPRRGRSRTSWICRGGISESVVPIARCRSWHDRVDDDCGPSRSNIDERLCCLRHNAVA
jgi:hypothetical protein